MTLRMRVLPRFPATITATNGLTVERPTGTPDLIVKPDFGQVARIPSVANPDKRFFLVWDEDDDSYAIMSFEDTFAAVIDTTGLMTEAVYDPQGIEADAFDRANHTGTQAISTIVGLQAEIDAKLALAGGTMTGDLSFGGFKITNALAIVDTFLFADPASPTKRARFAVSGVTAGQTRILTVPDRDVDLGKIGWELVGTVDLTGAASTAGVFTGLSASTYDQYRLEILGAVPATGATDIYLENSINNGSSYGATSDVNWRRSQQTTASATITGINGSADTKVIMANNISNTANLSGVEGSVTFFPSSGARTRAIFSFSGHTGTQEFGGEGTGFFAAATNALRVRPSSGNWTSGRLNLYGIRH